MAYEIINGSKVLLKFSDSSGSEDIVACSTSCVVNINQDFDSVVCKDTNTSWQQNIPKTKSWDMSVDALYAITTTGKNWADVVDLILNSKKVYVVVEAGNGTGSMTLSGTGYIESTSLTANADENATFSASIKGDGALTSQVNP
jgi:TP901-1 family phage major tail protein